MINNGTSPGVEMQDAKILSDGPPPLGKAAVMLAELGYRVFPVRPGGKAPATPHGCLDATCDIETIENWWTANPAYNIGVSTDGLLVVDVDVKDGVTPEWFTPETADRLTSSAGAVVRTPRTGWHLWYRQPDGVELRNTTGRIADGIDTRANGGYVVCYPSVTATGAYTAVSELDRAPEDLPPVPQWLLDELPDNKPAAPKPETNGTPINPQWVDHRPLQQSDDAATVQAALSVLDPDCSYDDWVKVGMAVHSVMPGIDGEIAFDQWSRSGAKYVEGEPSRKWKSFNGSGGVTLATLCKMADDTGRPWRPQRPWHQTNGQPVAPPLRHNSENQAEKPNCVTVAAVDEFQKFPVEVLPNPVRGYVREASKAIGCDPAFIALPMLVGCAGAIGNSRRVRLKAGWTEPPILWGALVGASGDHKSPALEKAIHPLQRLQRKAMRQHDQEMQRYTEGDLAEYERAMVAWKKSNNPGPPPIKPEPPKVRRVVIEDCTIEAVGSLLHEQQHGLLLSNDELAGWWGSFERYKKSSDAPHWLKLHGGRTLTIDRKMGTPKTLHIPNACCSVIGGIQPVILGKCLTQEHRANGMLARMLLCCPPRRAKKWTEAEIHPDSEQSIMNLYERLLALEMEHIEDDDPRPVLVGLSPDAKSLFVEFYNSHALEQSSLSGELAAAWSKLEGYAPRLALVIQCIRWAAGDTRDEFMIDADSMSAGITLANWFGHEARRVYALMDESEGQRELRELVEWIEQQGGRTTVREMQRGPHRFRPPGAAEAALQELVRIKFGRWDTTLPDGPGRPRTDFILERRQRHKSDSHLENGNCVADTPADSRIGEQFLPQSELDHLMEFE